MTAIKLIVGLGNPGKQYESTRHNAGFWLVDELARNYSVTFSHKDKFFGDIANISVNGQPVYLLMPDTFMNLSGKSVQALAAFYRIDVKQILVAHDELDLSCGAVKFKYSGGHGGHNGLRDIIRCMGSPEFYRLRIGIDHPGHASQVTPHVLNNPSKSEKDFIDGAIDRAISEMPNIIHGEFETAMQTLHSKGK